jgi:hypothetical protein
MYAPREPNVRIAFEPDPGQIRHLTRSVGVGDLSGADRETSPPSDCEPASQQSEVARDGRTLATSDSPGSRGSC